MSRIVRTTSLAVFLFLGCSKSELFIPQTVLDHPIDNKIEISGGFCAEDADSLESFLKIMFIIDRSNSMVVTDPNNRRISAAQEVVLNFVDDPLTLHIKDGVQFAILSFYGEVITHTKDDFGLPGFSDDGPQIIFSLTQAATPSSNTGYDKALAQAFLLLDRDMAQLDDKARSRTRYEVIFVSDGMPFPDNCQGEVNAPSAAVRAVERVCDLKALHRVSLTFHTAFASVPAMFTPGNDVDQCQDGDLYESIYNTSLGEETQALLRDMAGVCDGTFKLFENGDAINFLDFDFAESRRLFALSSFAANNINARPALDHSEPDSDGDGLPDIEEVLIGSSPYLEDSDGDGFNDSLEWDLRLSGLDPLDPTDGQCGTLDYGDSDGDGLRDCEEAFLGTRKRGFDSDADGLPDSLEVAFNANANSANPLQDSQSDGDADGGTDAEELKWHTNPRLDDVSQRSRVAYDYFQRELPITSGQACYDFEVRNVTLASTVGAPANRSVTGVAEQDGWNRIYLYFAQTPYDDPLGDPIYRMACVDARFIEERDLKIPANGHIDIPPTRPSDTYRATEVLRPESAHCQVSNNTDCGLDAKWCKFEANGSCSCCDPPSLPTDPADGVNCGQPCATCANGIDDDGDGKTDFPADPDCFDSWDNDEDSIHACSNKRDDDNDGRTDWPNDPGCDDSRDNDETNPATLPQCSDGVDNDNDGVIDFPSEPGCYAAADNTEGQNTTVTLFACQDGVDNDGDGLIDMADGGCFNPQDLEESGPSACFFCECLSDVTPNQCDIGSGYCKPRSGIPPGRLAGPPPGTPPMCRGRLPPVIPGNPPATYPPDPCASNADCRGSVCRAGTCSPCLVNADCDTVVGAADGVCDSIRGWCLAPVPSTAVSCTVDANCVAPTGPGGTCETDIGYCDVDPYNACRTDKDCKAGDRCSRERGFCLTPVFNTAQCNNDISCNSGICDTDLGWCLPDQGTEQCIHDDECPFGDCKNGGYCEQQTFVFPEDFNPDKDCLIAQ